MLKPVQLAGASPRRPGRSARPPLAELTTFRMGGRPGRMLGCATEEQVIAAVAQADAAGGRLLVLGGGSNLIAGENLGDLTVVADRRAAAGAEVSGGVAHVTAQAGAAWDALVAWTVDQGWPTLAPLSGIPGSVGALPVQNVGAYGASASDSIELVRAYDRESGQMVELRPDQLGFGYRDSALKRSTRDWGGITPRWVVLSVTFALEARPATASDPTPRPPRMPGRLDHVASGVPALPLGGASAPQGQAASEVFAPPPNGATAAAGQGGAPGVEVRYAQLAEALGVPLGASAPGPQVRQAVLKIRRAKGMVLDPADHDTWSAGSYFTNPLITPEMAAALPPEAPRFAAAGGLVKTSAAWLMTRAGVERGAGLAPGASAATSSKHVLALTNQGGADAAAVLALEAWIVSQVRARFGITLTREPVLVD